MKGPEKHNDVVVLQVAKTAGNPVQFLVPRRVKRSARCDKLYKVNISAVDGAVRVEEPVGYRISAVHHYRNQSAVIGITYQQGVDGAKIILSAPVDWRIINGYQSGPVSGAI